jgi:hypothetical protein
MGYNAVRGVAAVRGVVAFGRMGCNAEQKRARRTGQRAARGRKGWSGLLGCTEEKRKGVEGWVG